MKNEEIVAKVSDLQDGEMKEVSVGEKDILLARIDGEFYAIGSECTHYGGPLPEGVLSGHHVRCPWHQACFDVATGELEEPPALDAVPNFDVRVEGENVIVSVPEEVEVHRIPTMVRHNIDEDERNFVIIGGGAAGNAAAETLRQDGFQGVIAMITRERHLPYDRPDLSKGYLQESEPESPILRSEDFYNDYDIEVLTEHEVVSIDHSNKEVVFSDDSLLKYDKLLLAPGSIPRKLEVPGAELQNVFTLRSYDDAQEITAMVEKSSNAVVVGASFIGMETAASMTERGLSVTVVAPDSVPFERVFGEEVGEMYRELHEENGVSFKLGTKVSRFEGNDKVEKVILENGDELETDFVLVGIGVKPATGFLKEIELNPDGSVNVDKNFRVTEDIYAAGDIANFIDWRIDERIRIEHWRLAEQHGRVTAHNMAGKEVEYLSVPFFWTNQLDSNLKYVGYTADWDDIIVHGVISAQEFIAFYVKNDKVLAAAGMGDSLRMLAIAELMHMDDMPTPKQLYSGSIDFVQRLKAE